jgi:hypothetical protein
LDIKRIAAITGVIYYLRDEELKKEQETTQTIPGRGAGHWALGGRQIIMSSRDLVQRRVFTRKGIQPVNKACVSGRLSRLSKIRNLTGDIISNIIRNKSKI